jgi:hypothetical protein
MLRVAYVIYLFDVPKEVITQVRETDAREYRVIESLLKESGHAS